MTTAHETAGARVGDRLRRNRVLLVVGIGVLAVITALSVLATRSVPRGGDLDPDNPSPNGAQAVARVLAAHGVDVSVVRRAAELRDAAVDAGATLVVTSPGNLGRRTAGQVARRSLRAGAVVLPDPTPTLMRALHLPLTVVEAPVGRRTGAACNDPLLSGLSVDAGPSVGYHTQDPAVTGCFRTAGPASLVARVDGDRTGSPGSGPTYAVAAVSVLTNRRVDRADNAAVALRLLGQRERLVWYVPDLRDVPVGDTGSVGAQLPRGLFPALWLVVAAVLAAMLWRGRRLGPLVVEPLPVVVKAVESTQGRGRLYRRVRDREHAAEVLRAATVRRLVVHLRLPAGTGPDRAARVAADLTGTPVDTVLEVLATRPVRDDTALTRLAGDLARLEREVHDA
jgi:Domain of unknown function (DUF4350)